MSGRKIITGLNEAVAHARGQHTGARIRNVMITPEQLAGKSEHSQQTALFCWAASNVDKYPHLRYMFAIPNGFYSTAGQKGKMKAEGLRSGVPDIMLPFASGVHHGLFIEMKAGKNIASVKQIECINFLRTQGYLVEVCYSWTSARDVILNYLGE